MASTARILYEVEKKYGRFADAPQIAVALYAAYLLDGGSPDDETAFGVYIDSVDDLDLVTKRIEGILTDPTSGEDGTRSSVSPSPSPESGD
jgi:hypothetical protein